MEWSCTKWVRDFGIPTTGHQSQTSLFIAFLCFDNAIQSRGASPVSKNTSPAVLRKAAVNTHGFMFVGSRSIHALTYTYTVTFTQKHTQTHLMPHTQTHWQCVHKFRTFGIAVCKLPSFQGKTWPFTSILVFACTNCPAVQTIPGR